MYYEESLRTVAKNVINYTMLSMTILHICLITSYTVFAEYVVLLIL